MSNKIEDLIIGKIREIYDEIEIDESSKHLGLFSGMGGLSLFFFEYI